MTKDANQEELMKSMDVNLVYLCEDSEGANDDDVMHCLGIGNLNYNYKILIY